MKKQITDTDPKIEKVLIDLIRLKTISQKLGMVLQLSSFTINLSKRALARRYPEKDQRELDLLFVKYNYGEELADKVNQYLLKLSNESK